MSRNQILVVFIFILSAAVSRMSVASSDLSPVSTGATASAPSSVAVITSSQLVIGASWTWQYFENEQVYSTERYTVIAREQGDVVWLEMASKFPGQAEFRATHRLKVPVARCLASYSSGQRRWSFDMFHWTGTDWEKIEAPSTLAFEEKFNCNPRVFEPGSHEYVTRFKTSNAGELFSQERWGRLPSSWFLSAGPDAGVAAEKAFPKAAGQPSYVFRRIP